MNDVHAQLRHALGRQLVRFQDGPSAWTALADTGVLGLRVPEAAGGLGMTVSDAEPVFDTIGEQCIAVGYLETAIVAAGLLQTERSPIADDILSAIATRGARVAVAGLDWHLRNSVSATPSLSGWRLDGDAKLVLGEADADWLLVAAQTERYTTALLALRGGSAGVTRNTYPTLDGRTGSDLRFIAADAVLLNADAHDALGLAADEAVACLAIEAAALMRRMVADTVQYTRDRTQFGQPLAGFQVIQHRLVDMHIQARRAGAVARRAMAALDRPWRERSRLASAAKATVGQAGRFVGQQAVQLHGGMGMTDELPIGRYFKRLTVIEAELGNVAEHRRRFARLTFDEAA
jgi:alkylation response protein AidB-like acyl-CoA dehydrogenase